MAHNPSRTAEEQTGMAYDAAAVQAAADRKRIREQLEKWGVSTVENNTRSGKTKQAALSALSRRLLAAKQRSEG